MNLYHNLRRLQRMPFWLTVEFCSRYPVRMQSSNSSKMNKGWPTFPVVTMLDTGFDLVVPGYSYGSINRCGFIDVHRIPKYCERSRAAFYYPHLVNGPSPEGKWWEAMFKDFLPFIVSARYEVLPAFYNRQHVNNMLLTKDRIVNLTKSTYQHYQEFWSLETQALLHRSSAVVVLVDTDTRRAIPLPESITSHFKGKDVTLKDPLASRLKALQLPQTGSVFTAPCVTLWSDVDPNNHVNQSAFHRLCDDVIADASEKGFFSDLKWDIAQNFRVTLMEANFLAELNPGDDVVAKVWQDADNPLKVYAILMKDDVEAFHYTCAYTPLTAAKY